MQTLHQINQNPQDIPTKDTTSHKKSPLTIPSTQISLKKLSLDPFYAKRVEIYLFGIACYSQRHNMILGCQGFDQTIDFYDAATLNRPEERTIQQLDGSVTCISYNEETDIFIMGCDSGSIYTFDMGNNELKKLRKCEGEVGKVAFVNSRFYAFGCSRVAGLLISSLDDKKRYKKNSTNGECRALKCLPERKIVFAGFENGSLRMYRANKLPNQRDFYSIKNYAEAMMIESMKINGKEYIVTADNNFHYCTIKIWQLVKGKMKLLRVIETTKGIDSLVCLENYKMIATVNFRSNKIEFWGIFSGKLEKTFVCEENGAVVSLFLMKDKNIIGGIGATEINLAQHSAEFIQLHPREEKLEIGKN